MTTPFKIYLHALASALVTECAQRLALKALQEALEPGITANRISWRIYANY